MYYLHRIYEEYLASALIFIAIIFISLIQSPLAPFANGPFDVDSGIFLYIGSMMSKGFLPYLNAWDNKGPLLYLFNMFGVLIDYNHGVWFIEIILLFIASIFLYKTFRFYSSKIVSTIIVVYILNNIGGLLIGGNYSEEYALPFSFIALYFFIKYTFQDFTFKNYQSWLIGATFAAVMLLRPNIATIWPAFCIIYFLDMIRQKKFSQATLFAAVFSLGTICVILPVGYYLISHNILGEFINAEFIVPMGMEKPSALIRLAAVLKLLTRLNMAGEILLVALGYIAVSIYSIRKRKNDSGFTLILLSTVLALLINIYVNSLSSYAYYHYAISFIPILSLPALFVFGWAIDWLRTRYPDRPTNSSLIYIAIFSIILVFPSFSTEAWQIQHNFNVQEGDPLKQLITANTDNDDKIQVFTSRADLYYITNRMAASQYPYFLGNDAFDDKYENHMLETMYRNVMEQKPKIIVLCKDHEAYLSQPKFETNNKVSYLRFLAAEYIPDTNINHYTVYLRTD